MARSPAFHRSLLCVLLSLAFSPGLGLAAPSDPSGPDEEGHGKRSPVRPTVEPVADLFFHLETGLDGELPRFELDRAWLGARIGFREVLTIDVVFDGARFADLADEGRPTPLMGFVARAFAEVRPVPRHPDRLWLRAGQTWTFLVPMENRTGGHRQVAKGWADRHGLQKSRDLGVSVGVAPIGRRLEFDVGVFNGGGFKLPEVDRHKQVNGLVVVRPLEGTPQAGAGLFVAGHLTWEPRDADGGGRLAHRLGVSLLAGVDSHQLHAGVEIHRFELDLAGAPSTVGGVAAYLHPTIPIPGARLGPLPLEVEGQARLDFVHRNRGEPAELWVDVGAGVALASHAAVSLDYGFTVVGGASNPEPEHRLLATGRFRY